MLTLIFFTAVNCGALTDPMNGMVDTSSGTTFMNTATYTCDTGYILIGTSTRMCQSDAVWSSATPTCESKNAWCHLLHIKLNTLLLAVSDFIDSGEKC